MYLFDIFFSFVIMSMLMFAISFFFLSITVSARALLASLKCTESYFKERYNINQHCLDQLSYRVHIVLKFFWIYCTVTVGVSVLLFGVALLHFTKYHFCRSTFERQISITHRVRLDPLQAFSSKRKWLFLVSTNITHPSFPPVLCSLSGLHPRFLFFFWSVFQ